MNNEPGTMKVLTRYLLRAHVGPLVFAFVALTGSRREELE